jgi:hypothetical protein
MRRHCIIGKAWDNRGATASIEEPQFVTLIELCDLVLTRFLINEEILQHAALAADASVLCV